MQEAYRLARQLVLVCAKRTPKHVALAARLCSSLRRAARHRRKRQPKKKMSKRVVVMGLFALHPGWTDTELAAAAKCSRGYLYKIPEFVKARELLKAGRAKYARDATTDVDE
jgi:hypothetical protein